VRGRHLPALDGLRALAVGGVVAYHLRLGWAPGGYLGVDLFFVLSGFLITGLLLEERVETGRIALGAFWARRARRLLPALLLLLAALALVTALGALVGAVDLAALRGDALATIAYAANWHQLAVGQSYFAQFQAPSPLQHTWSLAIEEQFYLLWPPLLAALLWALRAGGTGRTRTARGAARAAESPAAGTGNWRPALLWSTVAAAMASAAWMGWLAAHGAGLDRLYYGTDTRAADLLAGAALAVACAARPDPAPPIRRVLHVAGPLAAAGLAALWATAGTAGTPPRLMFEGGFALAALAAVVVLADARLAEPGPLGRLLRIAPLRFVGRISYGVYLWHWPVITQLTATRTGLSGPVLDLVQVAVVLAVSTASYYAVEQPLRRARLAGWPRVARAVLAPAGMAVAALVVALATVPPPLAPASAALDAGSIAGAGGLHGQVPVQLASGRVPSRSSPLRVLLVGDSVMQTEAPAVEAALDATGAAVVDDTSFPGWGLSTDRTWSRDLRPFLERSRPELVVAMWSWDDGLVLTDPKAYRADLERFVRFLMHPGGYGPGVTGVLFEQYPPLVPFALDRDHAAETRRVAGATAWSALVAKLPSSFPGTVQYLPLAPAVELGGRYTTWLPPARARAAPTAQWLRVRMRDNTHFCPAGAARYAAALVADLHSLVGLPSAKGAWWDGSWAASPFFRPGSGDCPADHPDQLSPRAGPGHSAA
jgi:peptidoglycan/LPS O-acetylase OafA/YrhL